NDSSLFWCNKTQRPNPFEGVESLRTYWNNVSDTSINWRAPDGMFWICGKRAYTELPKDWKGSCTIGIIQPGFFLLYLQQGTKLDVPV
ncbi:ENR1 protein, partial [Nyctibius bracteatus]|nr:ENR1 protein [Nyctibius bracteatus]